MERKITQVHFPNTPDVTMKRVAAYARVSTAKFDAEHSLSAQVSYYSDYIQKHKGWIYAGVYAEEGVSGTRGSRPEFQRMIADCRAGKIDLIFTKSISRFARNTIVLLTSVRELRDMGVDVYFEEQNIHTMSPDGELMMTILASYAQEESLSASENQKWRIKKKFEQGEIVGWCQQYGYRINNGHIEIDEEKAKIVRRIFSDYLDGKTISAIATELRREGIKGEQGGTWTQSRVKETLRNEKYMGDQLLQKSFTADHLTKRIKQNNGELVRYYVEDTHPAIIDKELFRRVEELLNKEKHAPFARDEVVSTPFRRKIMCLNCGRHYVRRLVHGYAKWCCSTYTTFGKAACSCKRIPEEALLSESASVLGLREFDEVKFEKEIERIEVPGANCLRFIFKDGHTAERIWKDRSRSESWTQEMKEAAAEHRKQRGGVEGCRKPDAQ